MDFDMHRLYGVIIVSGGVLGVSRNILTAGETDAIVSSPSTANPASSVAALPSLTKNTIILKVRVILALIGVFRENSSIVTQSPHFL